MRDASSNFERFWQVGAAREVLWMGRLLRTQRDAERRTFFPVFQTEGNLRDAMELWSVIFCTTGAARRRAYAMHQPSEAQSTCGRKDDG